MIFVVGGSGGLSSKNAVLIVTFPAGSTVTATKGTASLKPTLWTKGADSTLECAIFSIPASKFDSTTPWAVTATNGTETASNTVLITTNNVYEVILEYKLWLYKNGSTYDSTTGGWQVKNYNSDSKIALQADRIYIKVSSSSGCVATVSQVDVTDYSSMHVVFNPLNLTTASYFYAGLKSTAPASTDAYQGSHLNPYAAVMGSGTDIDIVIDTSHVSGLYYAEVACSATVETAITQIWLEP